jgi:hypothetical protein
MFGIEKFSTWSDKKNLPHRTNLISTCQEMLPSAVKEKLMTFDKIIIILIVIVIIIIIIIIIQYSHTACFSMSLPSSSVHLIQRLARLLIIKDKYIFS